MNQVKKNKQQLAQLIKNSNTLETQLNQMKKSLIICDNQLNISKDQKLKKEKSTSLIKSSRIHMDQFQKRQNKLNSLNSGFLSLHESLILSSQKKEDFQNVPSKFQKVSNNRRLKHKSQHNLFHKQKCQNVQNTIKYRKQKTQKVANKLNQNIEDKQKSVQKIKREQYEQYLPRINSTYIQTFSPKNASLSQQTLVKRQLQKSVFKKSFDEKCKKYNKQNIIKEYEQKRKKMEQKLETYRLSVLKKISFQNVKKYLFNEKKRKQSHAVSLLEHSKLYKSFIQNS